jgi:hypothetical protein
LSPSEIPCPFCSTRGKRCSHLLADFDRTFADQGKYRIGLGGGTLYEVEEIGELFKTIADCYARTDIWVRKQTLNIGPKGNYSPGVPSGKSNECGSPIIKSINLEGTTVGFPLQFLNAKQS